MATAGGLAQISLKNNSLVRVYNRSSGFSENYITCLDLSGDGKYLYAGTPAGLHRVDFETGQITVFNRAKKQLSDDRVNAIYVEEDFLLVGTALGVDRYDIRLNRWIAYTALEGLAGNNIQGFAGDVDYLWAGGADGLSFYDRRDDFWDSYGVAQGLNSNFVTAVSADADAIWVGTAGGGLSRFDRNTLRFENLTSELGLIDDNVQQIMEDGRYLWIATFDGLSLLDKGSLKFFNYHSQNGLNETSITAAAVYGNKIYLGTDGGVYVGIKPFPQVSFNMKRGGYINPKELSLEGTILADAGVSSYELSYRSLDQNVKEWRKEGISPTGRTGKDVLLAKINTTNLPEGRYLVRLEVRDKKGETNTSFGFFVVDHSPPKIDLMFRTPKPTEKETTITGRYDEPNLSELSVEIGNKKVPLSIDKQQKRFRFSYPVSSGEKIKVFASDIAGNRTEIIRDFVVDNDPPLITVEPIDGTALTSNEVTIKGIVQDQNLDQVIVNPGQIVAKLTPIGLDRYEYVAQAFIKKEGTYTFKITAFDKGGRSATVSLPVKFFSDVTIVEIDDEKIPTFTLKSEVEFSGNILGPLLKEFFIEPGKIMIPVKADKSFSVKLPLKSGKNVFTLVAIHDRTLERVEQTFEIESLNKEVTAYLDPASRSFSQKMVTLRGKFDRGVSKVIINKKTAKMDLKNLEYSVEMELKDGANNIQITTVDELGRTKTKTEVVYLDREPPVIQLRRPPKETSLSRIPLKGRISDISDFELDIFPAGDLSFLSREDGSFEAFLSLKAGINHFIITAKDAAGNQSKEEFFIKQDPSFAALEEDPSSNFAQEIEALRREIEELKKRRPQGYTATLALRKLPTEPGLYFVPAPGKTSSLELAAKLYMGDEAFAHLLSGYNDPHQAKEMVIPSIGFFRYLQENRFRNFYDPLLRKAIKAYLKERNTNIVEKQILAYLLRKRLLKETYSDKEDTIFATKDGSAIVLHRKKSPLKAELKERYHEILILTLNPSGVSLSLVP